MRRLLAMAMLAACAADQGETGHAVRCSVVAVCGDDQITTPAMACALDVTETERDLAESCVADLVTTGGCPEGTCRVTCVDDGTDCTVAP